MNEKFSQFTARAALDGTEIFPLAVAGVDNYQITTSELVAAILGYGFTGGSAPQLLLGDGTGTFQVEGDGAGNWTLDAGGGEMILQNSNAQIVLESSGNVDINCFTNQLNLMTPTAVFNDGTGTLTISGDGLGDFSLLIGNGAGIAINSYSEAGPGLQFLLGGGALYIDNNISFTGTVSPVNSITVYNGIVMAVS